MNRHLAVGVALAVAASAAVITHNREQHRKVANDMGVVKDALNEINTQLNKVHGEFTGKLDELLARTTLDDEDRAAIEELRATADKLDAVVEDAVTTPLPDPDTAPDAGGDEPVVDPAAPVDPVEAPEAPAEEAPSTGDAGAADDEVPADEAPVTEAPATDAPADAGTVGDVAPDTVTEGGTSTEGGTEGDTNA